MKPYDFIPVSDRTLPYITLSLFPVSFIGYCHPHIFRFINPIDDGCK